MFLISSFKNLDPQIRLILVVVWKRIIFTSYNQKSPVFANKVNSGYILFN